MIYAPILITTLNRYEHFTRLIESLRRNSWADKTDIFISVDHPPNSKYIEGYNKIITYLQKDFKEFHTFKVYYQKENLSPYENCNFLIRKIQEKKYDSFIFLEDDNEVSKNFIEYMDKGLDKFKNDDSVIAICGNDRAIISNNIIDHGEGNYRLSRYLTYGLATWISVWKMMLEKCQNGFWFHLVYCFKLTWKLYKTDIDLYKRYIVDLLYKNPVYYYKEKLQPIDGVFNIYMAIFDKVVVIPNIPKIRNYGFDGSGAMSIVDELLEGSKQQLDLNIDFEFDNHKPLLDISEPTILNNRIRKNLRAKAEYLTMHIAYCILGDKAVSLRNWFIQSKNKTT